jgi:glycosyltransferase involved in cell wall biosynthesis
MAEGADPFMNIPATMTRIAIITTHPIQYNAPFFARLAAETGVEVMVFYTWSQSKAGSKYDPDFKRAIEWDIPLLEGYPFCFVDNVAARPGSDHFRGIDNPTLIREIEAWKPDALIIYGWAFRSHLACLRHFSGKIPIMFRGDSTLLDEKRGIKQWLRRNFLTWVYRHVDIGLCVGHQNRAYYLAHGLREDQLISAPHAIDNDRFAIDDDLRTAAALTRRRELGIQDDDHVLLFVGKLEAKKDPEFLLRLASIVDDKSCHVIYVGNGHLEMELKKQASGRQRVHFLGFQNQQAMPEIYRMGDVLVLPSRWNETWGLAVNEAMACGRPVLVSDRVGCAADLVEDGVTGWTFSLDHEAEKAVAAKLKRAFADPDMLSEMGRRARLRIQDHSIDKLVDGIHLAIRSINRNQKKERIPA